MTTFVELPIGQHFTIPSTLNAEWLKIKGDRAIKLDDSGVVSYFSTEYEVTALNKYTSMSADQEHSGRVLSWQNVLGKYIYPGDATLSVDAFLREVAQRIDDSLAPLKKPMLKALMLRAADALEYKAHNEAGQSQAPFLQTAKTTQEWEDALTIRAAIREGWLP